MAAHTPSTACLQARAARLRGRRAAGIEARLRSWGDCAGQLSIEDVLAELAVEDQSSGGERS